HVKCLHIGGNFRRHGGQMRFDVRVVSAFRVYVRNDEVHCDGYEGDDGDAADHHRTLGRRRSGSRMSSRRGGGSGRIRRAHLRITGVGGMMGMPRSATTPIAAMKPKASALLKVAACCFAASAS